MHTAESDPDDGHQFELLACAIAGREVKIADLAPGEPAWTDGVRIHLDPSADAEERLRTVATQASLIAAGSLDLLQGGLGEQVSLHRELPAQRSRTQNLQPIPESLNDAARHQLVGPEDVAIQLFQPAQIEHGVLFFENIRKTALGEPAVQWHLAAFEPAHLPETANRMLAFVAFSGGLTETRTHAAAHPLLRMCLPSRGLDSAQIHVSRPVYSTMASRWGTLSTMPRKPGVSGRSTT